MRIATAASAAGQRTRGPHQCLEVDLGAEVDEEERDGEAFADPDQLLGDPAWFAEQRHDVPTAKPAIRTDVPNSWAIHAT